MSAQLSSSLGDLSQRPHSIFMDSPTATSETEASSLRGGVRSPSAAGASTTANASAATIASGPLAPLHECMDRFCEALAAGAPRRASLIIKTAAASRVDRSQEAAAFENGNMTSVSVLENACSPFLVLSAAEGLYAEFAFVGIELTNRGAGLSHLYSQALSDLELLRQYIVAQGRSRGGNMSGLPRSGSSNNIASYGMSHTGLGIISRSENPFQASLQRINKLCLVISVRLILIDTYMQLKRNGEIALIFSAREALVRSASACLSLLLDAPASVLKLVPLFQKLFLETMCLLSILDLTLQITNLDFEKAVIVLLQCKHYIASLAKYHLKSKSSLVDRVAPESDGISYAVIPDFLRENSRCVLWLYNLCNERSQLLELFFIERRLSSFECFSVSNADLQSRIRDRSQSKGRSDSAASQNQSTNDLNSAIIALINQARGYFSNVALLLIDISRDDASAAIDVVPKPHSRCPPRAQWENFTALPRTLTDAAGGSQDVIPATASNMTKSSSALPFKIMYPLPRGMLGSDFSADVGAPSKAASLSPFYKNEAPGSVDRLNASINDSPSRLKKRPSLPSEIAKEAEEVKMITRLHVVLRLEDSTAIRSVSSASHMLPMRYIFDNRLAQYVPHQPIHEYVTLPNAVRSRDTSSGHSAADWIVRYVEAMRACLDSSESGNPVHTLNTLMISGSPHGIFLSEYFTSKVPISFASEMSKVYPDLSQSPSSNEKINNISGTSDSMSVATQSSVRVWTLICDGFIDPSTSQSKGPTQLSPEQIYMSSREVIQKKFNEVVQRARGTKIVDMLV